MAQCGETIELYVTVGNGGEATLGGLSGKLTESDPYLRLLYNSSASYPALAGGASGENRRDWDLRVSSNTPAGHEFRFTVTYTADTGGPWSIEVTIPISCGTAEPDPPTETTPERDAELDPGTEPVLQTEPDPLACLVEQQGTTIGNLRVIAGQRESSGGLVVRRFRVEVEDGLPVDGDCFARFVEDTLWDPRSWGGTGEVGFIRVDDASHDFRVILASPDEVDRLCAPLRTGGIFSCRNGNRIVINFWRWQNGAAPFADDLVTYRRYMINHEVGHRLGHRHTSCPGAGLPAPAIMQQTKGVSPCVPNGWPLPSER